MKLFFSVIIACLIFQFSHAEETFVVSYLAEEQNRDIYYRELIELALKKTASRDGEFRLNIIPDIPTKRRFAYIQQNKEPNAVVLRGYDEEMQVDSDLTYINFPVDLGALGWRICFINEKNKAAIKSINSLDDLRRYSMVQGLGWGDNKILRENGLRLTELDNYERLFQMVASGRADFFCRGFNEIAHEYETHKTMTNLTYDENLLITYRMPYFLYINKKNTQAKERLETGLRLAYDDGSLLQLWTQHFGPSIQFANFKNRKLIHLQSAALGKMPADYDKYIINPLTLGEPVKK